MTMKTKKISGGTKKIKRCGYTPYGYKAYINNQHMEFATESEFDEWIGDNDYGYDAVI